MTTIADVKRFDLKFFQDPDGRLAPIEFDRDVPFEVKRIYYDSSKGQCWISKERKKQFKTYFTTYGCRGR